MDIIFNNFFLVFGGSAFLLGIMGAVLSYVIIMSLVDNILD